MSNDGDSAIIVPFPALDEVIGEWRHQVAEPGLDAHVTLLYPFKPVGDLDEDEKDALRGILAGMNRRSISFERISRFPGVLFLDPDQPSYFSNVTDLIVERWPAWLPYGGIHDEVIPHATVTMDLDESGLDKIEQAVRPRLPITVVAEEAKLITFNGSVWSTAMVAPLAHE